MHDEHTEMSCNDCSRCSIDGPDHREHGELDRDGRLLSGWRLCAAWIGVGLGPIVLAIAGAASAGESHGVQLAAGLAGLGIGLIGSVVVAQRLCPAIESERL